MFLSWNIRYWFKIISEACEIFALAYILEDLDRKDSSKIGNIWIQHALNSLYQLCLTIIIEKFEFIFKKIWQLSVCPCLRGNNTRCLVPGSQQWSWLSCSFGTPWFPLIKLSCVYTSHQYHSGPHPDYNIQHIEGEANLDGGFKRYTSQKCGPMSEKFIHPCPKK